MRYRRSDGEGAVLHEVSAPSTGWVCAPDTLIAEAAARGLRPTAVTEDVIQLRVG